MKISEPYRLGTLHSPYSLEPIGECKYCGAEALWDEDNERVIFKRPLDGCCCEVEHGILHAPEDNLSVQKE